MGNALKKAASLAYGKELEAQKALMPNLEAFASKFKSPPSFPKNKNHFLDKCDTHSFKVTGLGNRRTGILKGHLLYQQMDDKGLFLIQNYTGSFALQNKIGSSVIIKHVGMSTHERLVYMLDVIKGFSKDKGFKSVYVAWDHEIHSLLTTLKNPLNDIVSVTTLSNGLNRNPLTVIEILVP